jgi:hypothetical protein
MTSKRQRKLLKNTLNNWIRDEKKQQLSDCFCLFERLFAMRISPSISEFLELFKLERGEEGDKGRPSQYRAIKITDKLHFPG